MLKLMQNASLLHKSRQLSFNNFVSNGNVALLLFYFTHLVISALLFSAKISKNPISYEHPCQ